MKRGELWWANLGEHRPLEQTGRRPVIVWQSNALNGVPQSVGRSANNEPGPCPPGWHGDDRSVGVGETDWWGNIAVTRNQSIAEHRATLYHEWVHRVLSPQFGPLRTLRAQLRASAYWRSALLRYLEEAMAESYGQLRAYGLGDMLTGLSFPITGGYVTVSQLVAEGVAIGNILVGGAVFHVVVIERSWEARGTQ